MGTLYKRGDTWHADYLDREGRRRRISTRTGDIKVARARLRELELATTDRAPHPTEALDDALRYFVDVDARGLAGGHRVELPPEGSPPVRLLGPSPARRHLARAVERYIAARLAEGAHPHSVHKELVVLRGALAAARGRGLFHGPADVVPRFRAAVHAAHNLPDPRPVRSSSRAPGAAARPTRARAAHASAGSGAGRAARSTAC
jgi:hypothetical protein